MNILDIPVPEVYKTESADFRFFMKWFALSLSKVQYDTEEFFDLFDPLRCPAELLWLLGDTMGYKYDERGSIAFNRLVLIYFMSMIRLKGSKDGLTLAAQLNLDQLKLKKLAEDNSILNNRLEDTSIPSNAIYVQPHVEEGYIDLVYFSDTNPDDLCTEYVRPVGMYVVPHAGVRYDAKDKIRIDARLTNSADLNISISPTHVGHYSEDDYSRMQRLSVQDVVGQHVRDTQNISRDQRRTGILPDPLSDTRQPVWYRNSKYETKTGKDYQINPGYRALYSLQLSNGTRLLQAVVRNINDVSNVAPQDVSVVDATTGEVFDNNYYQSQNAARLAALEYVPPKPMSDMNASMAIYPQSTLDSED